MNKDLIKEEIVSRLSGLQQVDKIIIFGSFIWSENPNDIDIAVFSTSQNDYLTQALLFRKLLRGIVKGIPMDILPINNDCDKYAFQAEISRGEKIYERGN